MGVADSLPNVRFNNSAPVVNKPKDSDELVGEGDADLECVGLPSGLLQGVAVGEKFLSSLGVATHDGVTALMPRSLSILARLSVVENVEVELRRLRVLGVFMPELTALSGALATRLPTTLAVTLV